MRLLLAAPLAAFAYAALYLLPAITAGLLAQPVQDNGYSPYSMFQRCHAAQFHIPTERC